MTSCFLRLLNFHMKDKPGGGGDAGGMDARVLVKAAEKEIGIDRP